MALSPINQGDEALYTTVDQFYDALKGVATDAYTMKNASNSAYALTVLNTGTGGHLRVRNTTDASNLLTIGDTTTTLGNDISALSLTMTGGVLTTPNQHSPRIKVVETGSSATPLYNYQDWQPWMLMVLDNTSNPNKTGIWIESISTDHTTASGSETAGSDGQRARINDGIIVFHYANKDNGSSSSAISGVEWGNANAGTFFRTTLSGSGARPVSIAAPNDPQSLTYGRALECFTDGYSVALDVQSRHSGINVSAGVGWQSKVGDSGVAEYSDGLRVYPYLADVSKSLANGYVTGGTTGTASGGSTTTLVDSGSGWTVNEWAGYVVTVTGGTGSGQSRIISSNTSDTLTIDSSVAQGGTWTATDGTSTYRIALDLDKRSAISVSNLVIGAGLYRREFDSFNVKMDGKTTITAHAAGSTTPAAANAYLRMVTVDSTAGRRTPGVQFAYRAQLLSLTGAVPTEKPFAAIEGTLTSSSNNGSGGISFSTRQVDSDSNLTECVVIDESGYVDLVKGLATRRGDITCANGLNSNIAIAASAQSFLRITGPTGVFSVGGFANGRDGQHIWLYNSVAQDMTIVNEDASSTAANRITTLTGGNVTLTGVSAAHLIYDASTSRWICVQSES